jgi:excisionase family DNA binding protein
VRACPNKAGSSISAEDEKMPDEMYTTRQAAIYLGITETDIRLAIREGKLKAWAMPLDRGFIVRKSDLLPYRHDEARRTLTRQLQLFAAGAERDQEQGEEISTSAA